MSFMAGDAEARRLMWERTDWEKVPVGNWGHVVAQGTCFVGSDGTLIIPIIYDGPAFDIRIDPRVNPAEPRLEGTTFIAQCAPGYQRFSFDFGLASFTLEVKNSYNTTLCEVVYVISMNRAAYEVAVAAALKTATESGAISEAAP